MKITSYHAKYFAYELTRQRRGGDIDRLSQSLFDSSVDLNPHQIDAALFALQNPLSKGVLLADEVGLGKTIEAALVLFQNWAERKRRLIIICPAALRKQWANEMVEKFHLPIQILDAKTWRNLQKEGIYNPLESQTINILSYNFAIRLQSELSQIPWDLVVMDEAHKLRNAHRDSHKTGQGIKKAFAGCKKLLITATPLQNSLMEVYGLSTVIDEQIFGDAVSFRTQFTRDGNDITGLQHRLREFCKRTLRKDVLEYIKYTERKAITVPFTPGDDEFRLYQLVSAYLQRENTYGIPFRQRHLVALVVRKILASSTSAVVQTLETILVRIKLLEQEKQFDDAWLEKLIESEDLDDDFLEEIADMDTVSDYQTQEVNKVQLQGEIAELENYIDLARSIKEDEKSHALIKALEIGFNRMSEMVAPRKAVIFTESRRTQDYLESYLEKHGYADKVVTFNGSNSSQRNTSIYQNWLMEHAGSDRITGSAAIDKRTALIDHFQDKAEILIGTEAAAEGVNLQFCSLVINYDLPWNPQRVEQRIGRCHRYGQKFDVVVINFLNQRNEADRRVIDLLSEKFHLFDGLFGASDEILGQIESGLDFEKRIAKIYDTCRTPAEIDTAFDELQAELESVINERMRETEDKLFQNFDQKIQDILKIQKLRAEEQLDYISRLFWQLTQHILTQAKFDNKYLSFQLPQSPVPQVLPGKYVLIQKGKEPPEDTHLYRMIHPLGEFVLDQGRRLETPVAELSFNLTEYSYKVSALEQIKAKSGWLELNQLELDSFQREEHLVFTALSDEDELLDAEACQQLFSLKADVIKASANSIPSKLQQTVKRQMDAALNKALQENDTYFKIEREKLEAWADDQIKSTEQKLTDTKLKIRDTKRRARQAQSIEEEKKFQDELKKLEKQQRHQRQEIFDVEDAIEARRDQLIDALEKRMHQKSSSHHLFRIRWQLV